MFGGRHRLSVKFLALGVFIALAPPAPGQFSPIWPVKQLPRTSVEACCWGGNRKNWS
jgi:hypothetical protein